MYENTETSNVFRFKDKLIGDLVSLLFKGLEVSDAVLPSTSAFCPVFCSELVSF